MRTLRSNPRAHRTLIFRALKRQPNYQVGQRVFLRAIKNIKSGDEITYDYGTDYLNNVITCRGCKCDKCRNKRAVARARLRAKARRGRRRAPPKGCANAPLKPRRTGLSSPAYQEGESVGGIRV